MNRVLIIGLDTVVGNALGRHFSDMCQVAGLWFRKPVSHSGITGQRISESALQEQAAQADTVIFCGDAGRSSWDDSFGELAAEQQWLEGSLNALAPASRFVFVSSDAVYSGPALFHNDGDMQCDRSQIATELLKLEERVQKTQHSLILRTNALGVSLDGRSWCDRIFASLNSGRKLSVRADVFSTPIFAGTLAELTEACLNRQATGILNIAGAERTTPWHLATAISTASGANREQLSPLPSDGHSCERSLRCQRLRSEFGLYSPMVKDLVEHLTDLVTEQRRQPVAA